MLRCVRKSLPLFVPVIFVAGINLGFVPCSWGYRDGDSLKGEKSIHEPRTDHSPIFARRGGRAPAGQGQKMEKQVEEWRSLSPEEKRRLRLRMDQWEQMPGPQRDLYRKRYEQWQQIDPQERRQLEDQLYRWDKLSPEEQDQIRRRFKD